MLIGSPVGRRDGPDILRGLSSATTFGICAEYADHHDEDRHQDPKKPKTIMVRTRNVRILSTGNGLLTLSGVNPM